MRIKWILLLGFLFVTGCSFLVTKPEVAIKNMTFTGLERNGIEMELLLSVTNPNSYTLTLAGYKYSLLVTDLPLAKGENRDLVEFKGKTTTDIRLPVTITFHDLGEILSRRPDPEHIPYQLEAGFDLHTPFGAVNVPVKKSGNFSIPRKYRLDGLLRQFDNIFKKDAR